jgi:predicted dehydrogenase
MKTVTVGIVGAGFIAALHMYGYRRVFGVEVIVKTVCSRGPGAAAFARKHAIPEVAQEWRALLADPGIDVIDLCTPPATHAEMVVAAMQAGKHVICEKPFTGYFGRAGDPTPIGTQVSKRLMFERVMAEMQHTADAIRATGRLFLYAEDWVYAPAIAKTAEIIRATGDKILFMKAEESHSGSHAAHAARWDQTGGGALIRQGCHPLSACLYLKQVEAAARGETIAVRSVVCDVGNLIAAVPAGQRPHIHAAPIDVEDWGTLTATFTDGTKATVCAGDMVLGGVRNLVEAYTTGGVLHANIAPNTHLLSYATDETRLGDVYFTEKVDRKTGWQFICLEEEWTRGYLQEIQDFMECAASGRQPVSGLDLAMDAIRVHYAAYWSAQDGRRVDL